MAPTAVTSSSEPANRLVSLDVLRAVAVLLVIGRHMDVPRPDSPFMEAVLSAWLTGGWVGVDLFFVLSGFLISGLLFREHASRGGLRVGRFLIRRGLKIYPPFYVLLAYTVVVGIARGRGFPPLRPFLGELLYLQNYLGGLWNHTWSLAVEEHFYILLPLLLVALLRRPATPATPFAGLPRILVLVLASCLLFRLWGHALNPGYTHMAKLFPTHLRMDGLSFGVLLSYGYHLQGSRFRDAARQLGAGRLLVLGLSLLLPNFLWVLGQNSYLHTWGLTANLIGSGAILVAALLWEEARPRRRGLLAYVGFYSYSIYLWHIPVKAHFLPWLGIPTSLPRGGLAALAVYVILSCVVGVVMAKLVELPVLHLRDRLFPSRSGPMAIRPAGGAKT